MRDGEAHHGVRLKLIPDIVRDDAERTAELTLDWARRGRDDDLVVALGLTGREAMPNEPLRETFSAARRDGLRLSVHTGEFGDPASIREVLRALPRPTVSTTVSVRWTIRSFSPSSPSGVCPSPSCPTSNVALGVCGDHAAHPFDRLKKAGADVSVHTDDPQIFGINLTREYLHLNSVFGYGAEELAGLSLAALRQAFLPEEERTRLEGEFRESFRRLGGRHLGRAVEP